MDMFFTMEYLIIYFFIFFLFFVFSTFAYVSWLIFINLAFLWHFDTGVRQVLIYPFLTTILFMSLVFSPTQNLLQLDYNSVNHNIEKLLIHYTPALVFLLDMVNCYTKCEPHMSNVSCAQNKLSKKLLSPMMYTSNKPSMVSKKWHCSICVLFVIYEGLGHILKKKVRYLLTH